MLVLHLKMLYNKCEYKNEKMVRFPTRLPFTFDQMTHTLIAVGHRAAINNKKIHNHIVS